MKLKFIAALAIVSSTNSFAVTPDAQADIELFIAGSASYDDRLEYYIEHNLCSGDFDTFLDSKSRQLGLKLFSWYGEAGENYRAWSCIVNEQKIPDADPGDILLIHKNSTGRSGFGVFPVARQSEIERLDLQNAHCEEVESGEWKCTQITTSDTPLLGVSDTEPQVFKGLNVVADFGDVTQSDTNALTIFTQAQQVSGIIVATQLRDTLQTVQGLAVGAEDEVNMPNISSNLIRSLFTGQLVSWYDVVTPEGMDLYTFAEDAGFAVPEYDSAILCIRTSGAGARAKFMTNYLRTSCLDSSVAPWINAWEYPEVHLNASSSDMSKCVADFSNNGWAVGYQSTDKNMDLADNYRFVKIDGAAPTLENVANDKYLDWVEQSLQYNTAAYNAADALTQKVIDLIAEESGQPSIIAGLNTKYQHLWGQGGYMAKPTDQDGIQPPAFPFYASYPVNRTTRSPGGFGPDSCRPPVHVFYAWPGAVGF